MPDPTKGELRSRLKRVKAELRQTKRSVRVLSEQLKSPPMAPYQLYRLPQVASLVGVHPRTIERWMETEDFPRPFKIGPSAIAWRTDEIESWVKGRPRKESSELEEWGEMTQELKAMAKGLR